MQTSEFLFSYGLVLAVLVLVLLGLTILRWRAVKQYRLLRLGEVGESALATLGDKVSNLRWYIFDQVFIVIYIVVISQGLSYLGLVVGFETLQLPFLVIIIGGIFGAIVFLQFTLRGQVYRRTERILNDHQTIGHEDWIIQKHLAELIHESESDDHSQVEIAKATLENLQNKQNRTGDAVRRIMESPEQLRDIERMKTPPNIWMSYRFSLLILVGLAAVILYFGIGFINGVITQYDLFLNALPITLLSILVFALCLCVEGSQARSARRKTLFGV